MNYKPATKSLIEFLKKEGYIPIFKKATNKDECDCIAITERVYIDIEPEDYFRVCRQDKGHRTCWLKEKHADSIILSVKKAIDSQKPL